MAEASSARLGWSAGCGRGGGRDGGEVLSAWELVDCCLVFSFSGAGCPVCCHLFAVAQAWVEVEGEMEMEEEEKAALCLRCVTCIPSPARHAGC